MDLAHTQEIFEQLYSGFSGYDVARQEKERLGLQEAATTYGEVVPPAFLEVVREATPKEGEVFFDLGSGTGKATFLAALAFPFGRVVGIELLPGLGDTARKVLSRYDAEVRPRLSPEHQNQRIEFIDGDFLQQDFSVADVVFAHGTCYGHELIEQLTHKLKELKPGARVIMAGHTLSSPELAFVKMKVMKTDWGSALAAVYQRR
ncbi:MAG TPA: SAM-dependent methyltransferase [Archangium sp.]|jgi:precorrin-6B methylase 2|uniref:SAM-dependent methyltransferase n=1 Tax=Archangium sp. TaxID=1872627 RepID=UPI002ED82DE8